MTSISMRNEVDLYVSTIGRKTRSKRFTEGRTVAITDRKYIDV